MRGEQALFNLEIKKKSGLSINPDIPHSKVPSSGYTGCPTKHDSWEIVLNVFFHNLLSC